MRVFVFAFSLLALSACGDDTPSSPFLKGSPAHYVNPQYGLDVALPRDMTICVEGDDPTSSHGFAVILEPRVDCKALNPQHRRMDVYVGFEIEHEFSHVADLAEAECGAAVVPPADVQDIVVPGHAVAVCRDKGGSETKAIVLLNGDVRPFIDVQLSVSLVTTDAHASEDMKAFKSLLAGAKLEKKPAQQ